MYVFNNNVCNIKYICIYIYVYNIVCIVFALLDEQIKFV